MVLFLVVFFNHLLSKLHALLPQPHPSVLRVGCAALSPHAQRARKKKPLQIPTFLHGADFFEPRRSTALGRSAPIFLQPPSAAQLPGSRAWLPPGVAPARHQRWLRKITFRWGRGGTPCSPAQGGGVPSGGGGTEGRTLGSAGRECVCRMRMVVRAAQLARRRGRWAGWRPGRRLD